MYVFVVEVDDIVPQEAKNSITTNQPIIVIASMRSVTIGTNIINRLDFKKSPAAFIIAIAIFILLQKHSTKSKNIAKIQIEAIPKP